MQGRGANIMAQRRQSAAAALAACAALAWSGMAPAGAAQAPQARAQDAATQRQSERTDQANREAAVADEASAAQGHPAAGSAGPAVNGGTAGGHTPAAGLSYGPVLAPRGPQDADPVRKAPAEVRDEADTLARDPAPQQARPQEKQLTDKQRTEQRTEQRKQQLEEQRRRAARRHQAWQGEGPMAPRPLRSGEAPPATAAVPIPPPLPAPQPTVPSSSVIRACQGIACTDAAGNTFNGSGNAGVGSGGRMCTRTGTTVQCF
jgi:hypothetical protein